MKSIPRADPLRARCHSALVEHRRRAREDGARLDYGLADLMRLAAAAVQCCYCRAPLDWSMQFDHKVATSRGGRHRLDNLAVACARCNAMKGQLAEPEFVRLRAFLRTLHPAATEDLERRLLAGGRRYERRRR